jgi:hypothetical protein
LIRDLGDEVIRNKRGELLTDDQLDDVTSAVAMVLVGMSAALEQEPTEEADKIPPLALALIVSYLSLHHEVPRERAMDVAEAFINDYLKRVNGE